MQWSATRMLVFVMYTGINQSIKITWSLISETNQRASGGLRYLKYECCYESPKLWIMDSPHTCSTRQIIRFMQSIQFVWNFVKTFTCILEPCLKNWFNRSQWPWPLANKICWVQVNVCANFEAIPSKCFWSMTFTRMGQMGKNKTQTRPPAKSITNIEA